MPTIEFALAAAGGSSPSRRIAELQREVEMLAANVERERQQKLDAWRRLEALGGDGPICDNAVCAESGDCGCV